LKKNYSKTSNTLLQISFTPLLHRGEMRIFIGFLYHEKLTEIVKKIQGRAWSKTHKKWHIPYQKEVALEAYTNLKKVNLPNITLNINTSTLKGHFETEKQPVNISTVPIQPTQNTVLDTKKQSSKLNNSLPIAANEAILLLYKQQLILMGYSASTIKTYCNEFRVFLSKLTKKTADILTHEELRLYFEYCSTHLNLSENSIHSRLNAIKFYYEDVLKGEKFYWQIPRPKKPQLLPKLLNETELRNLFNALKNKKHKAMLFTAYSAGLRVSEIINLKLNDIDSKRMQIFVSRAKGKKDRYVNLSPILLDILRAYIKTYAPKPSVYLFESEQTFTAYPIRTVQQIFTIAKNKANIKKEVGVHSLRHSFATHLLDKGTDIKYIKDLLGHFDIRTTERYLHVSKKQLVNIVSPLDDLIRTEKIDW
jgi:integrase/recombinase XerD